MSRCYGIWNWCPYPKKPKPSNNIKLILPLVSLLLIEVVMIANFALYTAPVLTPNTAAQFTNVQSGITLFGWNSTMKVPEVNSVVPASNLTIIDMANQAQDMDIKCVGIYAPENTVGRMNITIVNYTPNNVHISSIKLYENDSLLWSQGTSQVIPCMSAETFSISIPQTPSHQRHPSPTEIPIAEVQNTSDINRFFEPQLPVKDLVIQTLAVETVEGYTASVRGNFC
jgi:hypothetical protein